MKNRLPLLVYAVVLSLSVLAMQCQDRDLTGLTVDQLIDLLGDDKWETRERAEEELRRRGGQNAPRMLERMRTSEDAEIRDRLESVLRHLGAFVIGNRLVVVLTDLAQWKKNLEQQVVVAQQGGPNWRQQVRADLDRKFQAIRAKWLNEQDITVRDFLSGFLQSISVLADGIQPQAGATGTGQITQAQATAGLQSLVNTLRTKIDYHGDLDGDGMPTSWELQNGLNAEQNDANLDPDNDGKTNLQEFQQGTDPQKPN